MYEHAGASCLLSVLIVAVFAILLHEKEETRPAKTSVEIKERTEDAGPKPPVVTTSSVKVESVPIGESAARPSAPVVVANLAPAPPTAPEAATPPPETIAGTSGGRSGGATAKVRVVSERPESSPRPRKSSRSTRTAHPARSSFAEVGPGEGLADVATRVYGTPDAAGALWRANRDRIVRPEDPVPAGTWLRTP